MVAEPTLWGIHADRTGDAHSLFLNQGVVADHLGIEPPIIKVEVKSGEGSIGEPEVARLFGAVAGGEFGLFVTLSTFTSQAIRFAESKATLRLIDGDELVRLALEHYEQLDSRYKGLVPLKRVYIPGAIEEAAE